MLRPKKKARAQTADIMAYTSKKKGPNDAAWDEFECPVCGAENPWDDGFAPGETLFCAWCGAVLLVRLIRDSDPPRHRLLVE